MPEYALIVCYKNKEFLLVYNPERAWEFPGGNIKPQEPPKKAAKREFIEETGYKPKNLQKITKRKTAAIYKAKQGERSERQSEYAVGYFKELPDNLSFPKKEYREIIKKTEKQ